MVESQQPFEGLKLRNGQMLELYPAKERGEIARSVAQVVRMHRKKTRRPIPETEDDVMTGLSWRYICQMVSRGDLKGRKKGQLVQRAITAAARKGLTFEQVKALERGPQAKRPPTAPTVRGQAEPMTPVKGSA
jgi:hypothetical protein